MYKQVKKKKQEQAISNNKCVKRNIFKYKIINEDVHKNITKLYILKKIFEMGQMMRPNS